jgi:CelD/BcsL family acetyltransferase involved in cellulose biosynthesis
MMQQTCVREATPQEIAAWDQIVQQFPGWRVFHLRAWIESIEAFAGVKATYLMVEKHGAPVGCVPGFVVRFGPIRVFGSPREGWQTDAMGPVFDATSVSTSEVLSALIAFLERRYGVHHIEMAGSALDAAAMEGLGFRGQKVFTYRMPLFPGDEARTLSAVHSRTRTYMRSLKKGNLTVSFDADSAFVEEHYAQIQGVFARRGKSVPFSKDRVLQLVNHLKPTGHLLTVAVRKSDDGRCIGTGMFLTAGAEMYLWSWAHREEFGRLHPIELLTWVAMQKGMEAGCTSLDFSGGGQAKAKYGAFPDETNVRWLRSRYQWLAELRHLALRCYRMQQSARGRVKRLATRPRRAPQPAAPDAAQL